MQPVLPPHNCGHVVTPYAQVECFFGLVFPAVVVFALVRLRGDVKRTLLWVVGASVGFAEAFTWKAAGIAFQGGGSPFLESLPFILVLALFLPLLGFLMVRGGPPRSVAEGIGANLTGAYLVWFIPTTVGSVLFGFGLSLIIVGVTAAVRYNTGGPARRPTVLSSVDSLPPEHGPPNTKPPSLEFDGLKQKARRGGETAHA